MKRDGDNRRETEEQREKDKARQAKKRHQLLSDRKELLKMPEFQRVMADIIASGGMFHSVMTGNSMTFHKSGRQDFAREIWAQMAEADQDRAFDLLKPKFGEKPDAR